MYAQLVALAAVAFTPAPQLAPALQRSVRPAAPAVHMAGWNDPFAGNAMKEGGMQRLPRGRGSSKFDEESDAKEGSEVQKLALASAGLVALIVVPLVLQIAAL